MGDLQGLRIAPQVPGDIDRLGRTFGPSARGYYLERSRRQGVLLVARVGERSVGAVFVSTEPAPESAIIRHLGKVPMLHRLMVDASLRRKGVGTKLIAAAEAELRRRRLWRVAVGVDVDNPSAARLYRRLGYREWAHGLLETIREDVKDGKVIVLPDECHVFVKHL
ncbi:GNAT family N-acetyltransferase [Actinoplanes sp. NPDC049118]|uniref:GNAT family N-acetyltransferase n=1 Tax=Actinoplanes sp. NPDC049118 TaxID=3155769 RepID=UPI0033DAA43B